MRSPGFFVKDMKEKTISQLYGPAMNIQDQARADRYFNMLVDRCMAMRAERGDKPADRQVCISIQKQNLGYYAGYHNHETRERVERLFKCQHPIFGSIEENGAPSAEEAFNMGVKRGNELKSKD